MIMFPTLGKTTVNIGIGKGKWIEVDMLPVSDYARFREIQSDLTCIPDESPQDFKNQKVKKAREEILAMAKKVMPPEMRIESLDHSRLSLLVTTLCTGDDDSEKDDPKKKIILPSQKKNQNGK